MEQFRRAARREITCKYPPTEDDPSSVVSMSSPTMAVSLVEAVQPTEFLYDAIEPGLAHAWLVRGPQSALPEISHRLFGNARHSVPGDPLLVGD